MSNLTRIKKILAQMEHPERVRELNLKRQERLQDLVNKFDIEEVALAAGYAVSTLNQYLRVKHPSNIGEESVNRAEEVFKQL